MTGRTCICDEVFKINVESSLDKVIDYDNHGILHATSIQFGNPIFFSVGLLYLNSFQWQSGLQ